MYFEVHEKNEFSDIYRSRRHYPWKLLRLNAILGLIFGILILLYFVFSTACMLFYQLYSLWYAVIVMFVLGVLIVLKPIINAASARRTFKQIYGEDTCSVYEFGEDELVITTGHTVRTLKYTDFGDVTEDDEYFFLWITTQQIYILPKKYFVKGDVGEFVNFIRPRIAGHLPKGPTPIAGVIRLIASIVGIAVLFWLCLRLLSVFFLF